jgi:hypothetical protein
LIEELGADSLPKEYTGKCECSSGCIQALQPFPAYLKPPADLIPINIKAGKSQTIEFPLVATTAEEQQEGAQQAHSLDKDNEFLSKAEFSAEEHKEISSCAGHYQISWSIEAVHKDIDAEILFLSNSSSTPQLILSKSRIHSAQPFVTGSFLLPATQQGTVKLIFDNSFSYFTSKDIKYKLKIEKQL